MFAASFSFPGRETSDVFQAAAGIRARKVTGAAFDRLGRGSQ